jgi:hypothetical protein
MGRGIYDRIDMATRFMEVLLGIERDNRPRSQKELVTFYDELAQEAILATGCLLTALGVKESEVPDLPPDAVDEMRRRMKALREKGEI